MNKKKKHQGVQFGIVCTVFGLVGAVAGYIAMMNGKILTTVLAITPMLLFSGIAFLIVPGNDPPAEIAENDRVKQWWKTSSAANKAVWIIAGFAGIALGLSLVFKYADLTK